MPVKISEIAARNPIRFGTSGWRALIAEDFTFANVRVAVAAIAEHVRRRAKSPVLIVGHDTRFLSEEFARVASEVLRAHSIRVLLCAGPAPTPAIAYEILRRKTDGAINFTASHNPAEYQGLKFSSADGAPALPEVTKDIEARAAKIARTSPSDAPDEGRDGAESIDPHGPYLARLRELVRFSILREAKLKIVCDPLHGCGAGYLDRVLTEEGIRASAMRTNRDVLFAGHGPDVAEKNLAALAQAVRETGANVGLATDGDADRFGIVDADGAFVSPNHILALVYDYLVESRGWRLGAARSVATTHLLDAVARHHGLPIHETPVGFKYIGEFIKQDSIALGGEESAGLTIRGHVPEKDGILAGLLVAEMVAARRAPLAEQLKTLFAKVGGEFWPIRENLQLGEAVKARTVARTMSDVREFQGRRVARLDRTDGMKLIFSDGSWLLLRLSGTEPILRVYAEAPKPEASRRLVADAKKWMEA
jgi:alpha-D-glucose phosphate-specific phosphoglucomutase